MSTHSTIAVKFNVIDHPQCPLSSNERPNFSLDFKYSLTTSVHTRYKSGTVTKILSLPFQSTIAEFPAGAEKICARVSRFGTHTKWTPLKDGNSFQVTLTRKTPQNLHVYISDQSLIRPPIPNPHPFHTRFKKQRSFPTYF